jgi:hypothetical protein
VTELVEVTFPEVTSNRHLNRRISKNYIILSSNFPMSTNRLIHSQSPYLQQHAHNPVDWFPWGPEALRKAEVENKPILVSIGYSACHWCHVMERESFEDQVTAD